MFTRISSVVLAGVLVAPGCVPSLDVFRSVSALQPVSRFAMAEAEIVVAGPPGYCVDQKASRRTDAGGAFVLLGSCASLARDAKAAGPDAPGLLTVAVASSPTDKDAFTDILSGLASYFQSVEGRAALSRDGDATSVDVMDVQMVDDVVFVQARDAFGPSRGMSELYWRAFFGAGNRLLTVSVNGFAATPLTEEDGRATARALADQIRSASAAGGGGSG